MRKLSILKTLIDLAFFFSAIAVLSVVIFVPLVLLGYAGDFPIKIKGQEIFVIDWQTKLMLACVAASSLFFFYSIYLLRKTITFFHKRDLFNENVIRYFNNIGKCLITSALLVSVPLFFYNMVHENNLGISFDISFDSPLLAISLGLFFMVLSEVFKIARNLKEENDLTL